MSHKPNLQDAAGNDLGDVAEAEVVIFQPLGENKSKVMARVPAALWSTWIR